MPRPRRCRWIEAEPNSTYFKPRGIPLAYLEEIVLTVDEHEALRLADFMSLEQEEGAKKMKISRQTFGRILSSARKKVAEGIVQAKAIKIEGADYVILKGRCRCHNCGHVWHSFYGAGRSITCPSCNSINIHRAEEDRGCVRRCRSGRR